MLMMTFATFFPFTFLFSFLLEFVPVSFFLSFFPFFLFFCWGRFIDNCKSELIKLETKQKNGLPFFGLVSCYTTAIRKMESKALTRVID